MDEGGKGVLGRGWDMTHVLSSREDNSTDSEEAAMAAEPIQGCSTRPNGRNTPAVKEWHRNRKQSWWSLTTVYNIHQS